MVEVLKTISAADAMDELRRYNFPISPQKFKAMLKNGVIPGAYLLEMEKSDEYIIFERNFREWISTHVSLIEPI